MLKAAGVTKVPETWDEMREAAHLIKEKTGKATFGTLSELNYIEVLMRNAGADPLADGVKCDLQNEDIVSWMKEYKEMIDAGEADLFVGANMAADIVTAFYAGEFACMVNTIAITNQVDKNSDFEVATSFALKDKLDPPISCVAGAAAIIPALNDQNVKNAAWQFLTFLLSKENVKDWSSISATYPVRASIYTDADIMQKLYDTQPLYKNIYAGLDGVVSKNKTPYQTAAYKILLNAMGQYFYDGADFDTVWTNAEDEINNLLAGN
jgi:ABC-type glycerol-3-phosphate transport system substrate-binding protein